MNRHQSSIIRNKFASFSSNTPTSNLIPALSSISRGKFAPFSLDKPLFYKTLGSNSINCNEIASNSSNTPLLKILSVNLLSDISSCYHLIGNQGSGCLMKAVNVCHDISNSHHHFTTIRNLIK